MERRKGVGRCALTMTDYAHPDMLVSTEWVAAHGQDPGLRLLEVDVDTTAYAKGHIESAVGLDWTSELCDQIRRDVLTRQQFEALCRTCGIANDTIVVFYGDNNNWFAAYALWQFRYHGHDEARLKLMNGGRAKWLAEKRPVTAVFPEVPPAMYHAAGQDENVRAYKEQIQPILNSKAVNLVDVRSASEFSGEIIAPPGMAETAQRGGHIPGAISVPWAQAVRPDGTFKSRDDLEKLYEGKGLDPHKETITYCRIGERSSHTWFVLKYLLGYPEVRNYDGSWTEWGNLVGAPIERD